MLFAGESREALRQHYLKAWQRAREGLPLAPMDAAIADIVALHPEYHALLESGEAVRAEFTVEQGRVNPFLHMGLHLALREQLATDRPTGIRALHDALAARLSDVHQAEHGMIEVLAETLWEAQRQGRMPDEQAYLERLRRL